MSRASFENKKDIPFLFLCSLFREISQIPQTNTHQPGKRAKKPINPAIEVFKRWTARLHHLFAPIPPGTTRIIFKLLFPENDTYRKYDMQETTLGRYLVDCLGIDPKVLGETSGSLGDEVRLALQRTSSGTEDNISPLSISQVDSLLDELASTSAFSHSSIRTAYPKNVRRERYLLIRALFRPLSPVDASFLTQIILKDLRPVLYPLKIQNYSSALLDLNASSVHTLTLEHAMKVWDPTCWMLNTYRVKATINEAAASFELLPHQRGINKPRIGVPVQLPKSEKGRSCAHVLESLRGSKRMWAEIKYDGERAQIHVEILSGEKSKITIYSKSGRDSTLDRYAVHRIIRNALGLSSSPTLNRNKVKRNIILDAEMVACNGTTIDEFWRIRDLIENTARGVRHRRIPEQQSLWMDSQPPATTDATVDYHLALVFFDILLLDGKSLLSTPYSQRRALLESLILLSPGESMIARRSLIVMEPGGDNGLARESLEKIFVAAAADHQEGLVIKAEESCYHDRKMPWIKLKKDYIPGYGDAVDLIVIGATWDKARGRELRVPPSTLTTLYIGVLSNSKDSKKDINYKPHFHIYFTVSYGLTRSQLEEINFLIKNSDPVLYHKSLPPKSLPYNFTMLTGLQPPTWLLSTPLLAELFGAGFTKAPNSKYYELRFPRVTKIHRPVERGWEEAVTLEELQRMATDSVGLGIADNDIIDWSYNLWRKDIAPDDITTLKRKRTINASENQLSPFPSAKRLKSHSVSPSSRMNKKDAQALLHGEHTYPFTANIPNHGSNTCIRSKGTALYSSYLAPQETTPPSLEPYPHANAFPLFCEPEIADQTHIAYHNSEGSLRTLFLKNALIWIAKSHKKNTTFHSSYRLWELTLPQEQRIHSVDSLLAGCGWCEGTPGSDWAERGVVFLDEDSAQGRKWKQYILEAVGQRRRNLSLLKIKTLKPIWIMDLKKWLVTKEDPHTIALCVLEH